MRLQTIQAAPVNDGLSSGTEFDITITFEEDGVAHIADAFLSATADDVAGGGTDVIVADASSIIQARKLTLNGGTEYFRSRGTIAGINPLAPRDLNIVALPPIPVGSGDKLKFTGIYTRTAIDLVAAFGVPFTPKSPRRGSADRSMFGKGEVWVPSPETALTADGTNATITTTFDDHGYIDLSRLVVGATADGVANVAADGFAAQSHDDVPLNILDIHLRSEGNLVNGQGTPSSPNFFARGRKRNRVDLGVHPVAPGDTLVVIVESLTTALLNGGCYSGVPMVLSRGKSC